MSGVYPSGRCQIVLTKNPSGGLESGPLGSGRLDMSLVEDLEHDEDRPVARFSLPLAVADVVGIESFLSGVSRHGTWIYGEQDGRTRCLWLSNCSSEVARDAERVRVVVTYRAWRFV